MAQTAKVDRLLARLPSLADIVRGSLLHRTTFHSGGCSKCARGIGHPQWVLNVNYPGGKVIVQLPLYRSNQALDIFKITLDIWKVMKYAGVDECEGAPESGGWTKAA